MANDTDRLSSHFQRLPRLTFEESHSKEIEYAFPSMERPQADIDTFDKAISSNDAVRVRHGSRPTQIEELVDALRDGVAKLRYGVTSDETWATYMLFAQDRLVESRELGQAPRSRSRYALRRGPQLPYAPGRPVNRSEKTARTWFLDELIPSLTSNDNRRPHFLLGEPGTGKSTFIKWLLNTEESSLKSRGIIVSRFEFMKFMIDWYEKAPGAPLQAVLDDYISYVLLRDAFASTLFSRNGEGSYIRNEGALSPQASFERLKDMTEADRLPKRELEGGIKKLQALAREPRLEVKKLRRISAPVRMLAVRHFELERSLVLVLDGLDHVAVADAWSDTPRSIVLRHILKNLSNLGAFTSSFSYSSPGAVRVLSVMRQETLFVFQERSKSDVPLGDAIIYDLAPIEPRVAVHSKLQRALTKWADGSEERIGRIEGLSHLLMAATDTAIWLCGKTVGSREKFINTYAVFGGNLRTLFLFLERLLEWFFETAIADGKLRLQGIGDIAAEHDSAEKVLEVMTGKHGLSLLSQKRYRLIEILLFAELRWFENAVTINEPDEMIVALGGPTKPEVTDNLYWTGTFDNIFNYHTTVHRNVPAAHGLLEKIRIIQLVETDALSFKELAKKLLSTFGYACENLALTVVILFRSGLLTPQGIGGTLKIRATARGKFIRRYMLNSMTYLEHVFHRTLFPRALLGSSHVDEPRYRGVHNWTVSSIRNCFVFATYISMVENNRASGRVVPDRYRLLPGIVTGLTRTLRSIGDAESRSQRYANESSDGTAARPTLAPPESSIRPALAAVESTLNRWQLTKLLASGQRSSSELSRA